MAHLTVECKDKTLYIKSQAFCCTFKDIGKNRKALFVFLRQLYSPKTADPLFTHETIAKAFGYADRRNIENFVREFHSGGADFQQFLSRKQSKKERHFDEIEARILECPFLSIAEHYVAFCEDHPGDTISGTTFRKYVNEIDGLKMLNRIRQFWVKEPSKEPSVVDSARYLREVLEVDRLRHIKKKEIVERFPQASPCVSSLRGPDVLEGSPSCLQKKLLVVLLYVCNVSQEMLSLLCGVGKTSIHNWIYEVCGEELSWQILREIVCWSGQVSFDEKWIKIKGEWYFVLCAVDSVSGFPLLIDLYPTLDTVSWALFFKRFNALYGVPKLIQSDGSQALAAAREVIFPGVRYQLCKFHKLKNLMKRLRQHIRDPKRFIRCVRLAKHLFTNDSVSSRKQAAKTLQKLAGPQVSAYIDGPILACWRKLTLSLTNNVSERFNRKIKKCFSGRYGIPSPESAQVLLRGLWLKELLLNGQKHLDATSELTSLDLSRICQEHLDTSKILHFFHDYSPSHVEKLA